MSKEQINYLLALLTLFIVWLYFNTFFVAAKRSYLPVGGMMAASAPRFPGSVGMPQGLQQNIQQPPNLTELLRNQSRGLQASVQPPAGTAPAASQTPQKEKTR